MNIPLPRADLRTIRDLVTRILPDGSGRFMGHFSQAFFVTLATIGLAGSAAGQTTFSAGGRRPWLDVSVAWSLSGHENLNRPPLCQEHNFPCVASRGPARGAVFTVTGYPRAWIGVIGEVNTYSHLYTPFGVGPAREEINFLDAGVRIGTPMMNGASLRRARVFGDVMGGFGERHFAQSSDHFSDGRFAQVGVGMDWRLCPRGTLCVVRARIDYRTFQARARDLNGWRASVGVGFQAGQTPPTSTSTIAEAQRAEIAVGFTMQTPRDVNLPPLCQSLGLPCTSPRTFPDFGLDVAPAIRVNHTIRLVGDVSVFGNAWTPAGPSDRLFGPARATNHVRTALMGLRFYAPTIHFQRRGDDQTLKLFGQILGGAQWSSVVPRRRAIQPGFGVDIGTPQPIVVRVQFDYTSVRGPVRDLSTGRILFGVVVGR